MLFSIFIAKIGDYLRNEPIAFDNCVILFKIVLMFKHPYEKELIKFF